MLAETVIIAAGTTETPMLLRRSVLAYIRGWSENTHCIRRPCWPSDSTRMLSREAACSKTPSSTSFTNQLACLFKVTATLPRMGSMVFPG